MNPRARTEGLVKQVVGDETLIYDTTDASARRLNAVSAAVWRHSTGTNSIEEIAVLVAAEVALPAGADAVTIVYGALEELEQHGLMQPVEGETTGAGGFGRRDVLRTLAALPIFPSIDRIFAPTMQNAASNPPDATQTMTRTGTASATPFPTATSTSSGPVTTQTTTPSVTMTGSATPTATSTPTNTPTRTP
jgi:hypothetical protein